MAKKKKIVAEEKQESYDFIPKDFDEREFILKDLFGTKILFVATLLAVVVGILAAVIYQSNPDLWYLGMLIAFVVAIGMKKILRVILGFKMDIMDQKSMLGHYLIFLILALGICVVGINAPFM